MNTSERVDKVLAEQLGDGFSWDADTVLRDGIEVDGLSLDSLDMVELVMNLEEEFNIELSDELFLGSHRIATIGDLVNAVETACDQQKALLR